jgi:hypothetical protein
MAESIRGLAAIKANQQAQQEAAEARNRPKAEWFKWPKGVTTATVRFLQELDPAAENYREDRNIGFIQVEHQAPGPDGYKRRANCTAESEGQCYACERHAMRIEEDKGGWRQRQNLYINALVDYGQGEGPKVVVIQRNANSSFVQALIEEAVDEGSITNANFKVTKVGEGTTTQWLLKRLKGDAFDDSAAEVFDLDETAVRAISYDKQPEYYGAVYQGAQQPVSAGVSSGGGSVDTSAEW